MNVNEAVDLARVERGNCADCGSRRPAPNAKICDGCWELRHRIESDPALAARFLTEAGGDVGTKRIEALETALRELLLGLKPHRGMPHDAIARAVQVLTDER
jgi:hypothetical protein